MPRIDSTMHEPGYRAGSIGLALALASILGALFFEHVVGLAPCPLCLQQRYAYYAGVPAIFVALVLIAAEHPRPAALILGAVGLAFLANAGLGGYHAGVEWKLWLGPDTCATTPGPLKPLGKALLQTLDTTRVVRCDVAPWRFLGLSLAGWNVLVSLAIATAAFQAAFEANASRTMRS